jgi:protein Mpv17
LTSAVLSGLGNVAAQVAVERKGLRSLDLGRLWRFTSLGLLLSPVSHYKFLWLENLFRFARGKTAVYGKLAIDQLVFGPIFNVLFYVLMAILEGKPSAVGGLLRANFW